MSIRVMLDSDVLADLHGNAELLATYADLITTETELKALEARFPNSELVFIDRGLGDPLDLATVADLEQYAMTDAELAGWVARKKAAGKRYLTGYCDRNNLAAVIRIAAQEIWHWVATLDGTCHIDGFEPMRQPAAVQILGSGSTGIHADLSIVLEDYWHPRASAALFPAADVSNGGGDGGGDDADGDPLPDSPAPAAATGDLATLSWKAPAWDFSEEGLTIVATLRGTRVQLEGHSAASVEAQIRQLYPETIA